MKSNYKQIIGALLLITIATLSDAEPALPEGLENEPELPVGLGFSPVLNQQELTEKKALSLWQQLGVNGFAELRLGQRIREPIEQKDASLAELRLALEKSLYLEQGTAKITIDLLFDDVSQSQHNDLEAGSGWLDLREAWWRQSLSDSIDMKVGRQILTWGVGDLVFINDLFPKDWQSFLAGRDEQYLKAPSDALRMGFYSDAINVNLVYTPRFDSDRSVNGSRLSYYSPISDEIVGNQHVVMTDKPDRIWQEDEWALRVYRQFSSVELSAYAYRGYWKSPAGFNPSTMQASYPALQVLGSSARFAFNRGIISAEMGYYDSLDDTAGTNPWVNNSEWRGLIAYERDVAKNTTLAVQYYLEVLQDYAAYRESLMEGASYRDEYRHLLSMRFTRLALSQQLTMSVFAFYSPSDNDSYLRPKIMYKATDNFRIEAGMNVFAGKNSETFFRQFESNSNSYLALRYSF